jgi:hypothetical protein
VSGGVDDGGVVDSVVDAAAPKRTLKERLAAHFEKYGKIALFTYLTLSILAIAGFSIAIAIGAQPSSTTGFFGVIGAGWLAAKATMPIRILATLGLTPIVAAVITKLSPAPPADSAE